MSLYEVILKNLPPNGTAIHIDDHGVLVMRDLGGPVDDEYQAALADLEQVMQIARDGQMIRRSEPDFPEQRLEAPAQAWLFSDESFSALRLNRPYTVCQKTAVGGRQGSGIWSRPDFTIATIRRRKYDPFRHLDVLAFELKNLAGAQVVAVHEALAHTRFAHYAYLLCPRSKQQADKQKIIAQSCAEHGIGLVTFEIEVATNAPHLTGWRIDITPSRKTLDPDLVDQFLDDRLNADNKQRLLSIAGHAIG
jgi:hypothetical protein